MKKIIFTLVAACWVCVSLNAQIVVNASDYDAFFNSGNTQITDTTPTVSPGTAGANVTWNFSGLNSHLTKSNSFMAPSAGLLGTSFPMANVCMKQDTNYYYYDTSSTALDYWGFAGNILDIGTNDAIVYDNSETMLTFPSTYNTGFSDASSYDSYFAYNDYYQGYFVDSIRQKSITQTTSLIDAWGTITTPNATMPCLRQNISKHSIDTTWAKVFVGGFHYWIELYTDDYTTQSYSFISNIGGGLIATVEYFADSTAIAEVRWNPVTLPSITVTTQNNVLCNGGNNGSIAVSVSGGSSPYSFLWSNSATTSNISSLAAGTYTLTVTDAVNSTATTSVIISEPSALSSSIISKINASCTSCTDGSGTVAGSGGSVPYSFAWSNGQTTASATGLAVGSYTVTVTDNNNCNSTASLTIDTTLVLNSSDYSFFTYGNQLITDTAPTVTPGSAGANVTWDLSGLNTHLNITNTFMAPSAGVLGSSFPQANIAMKQDTLYHYFNNGTTELNFWGVAGNLLSNSVDNALVYSNPATVITFPSSYNTSFSDTAFYDNSWEYNGLYQGVWVDSLREKETIITTSLIDGWGNIITPNDTFPGMRQNVLKHSVDSTWAKIFVGGFHYWIVLYGDTFNVQTYNYISNVSGNTIASLEFYADSTAIVEAKWNPVTLPKANILTSTNILCNGNNTGSATATVSGGKTPYTYTWNTTPVQNTATATGLIAGTYSVTVTDAINNQSFATVSLTQPAALSAAITSMTFASCNSCTDGSGTVETTGGVSPYTYAWSNSQTGSTATGLSPGNYSVVITDANSCTENASLTIDSVTVINSTDYTFFTYGNDIIVDTLPLVSPGSAGANITWDLSGLNTHLFSSNTFMDPASGVLGSSYPQSDVAMLQDTLYHYFDTSTTAVEFWGAAGNLLSNNADNALVYSDPATVLTFPLTYNTAFTDTANYDNSFEYNAMYQGYFVDSLREKEMIITTSVIDGWGTIITPNDTFPGLRQNVMKQSIDSTWAKIVVNGFHYWIPLYGDTFNVQSYHYISTVSGNNIVSLEYYADSAALVEARWNPITLPKVSNTSQSNITCFGLNDGTATATVTGGKTPYTYSWNSTLPQTGATATGLPPGTYTVTILDSINNETSATFTITGPSAALLASITSSTNANCGAPDGTANVDATGGTTPYTYAWSSTTQTTASITGLAAGGYTVTVTDANGCTSNATANISNNNAATLAIDTTINTSCNGTNDGSATASATGGTGALTFSWNTVPAQNTATATGLGAGTYSVLVTDTVGCSASQSVTISEPTALSVAFSTQTNLSCAGDSNGTATVAASGGTTDYTYAWGTTTPQSSITATGLSAGSYDVTVTDANGCMQTATVTLTEPSALTATTAASGVSCFGDSDGSATVTATGGTTGYTYLWSGTSAQTTQTATGLLPGNYDVTVTDANGCTTTATATVNEPVALSASISAQTNPGCFGDSDGDATVTAAGGTTGYSYAWDSNPVQNTATATGLAAGTYAAVVTDANGCTSSDTVTISEPSALTATASAVSTLNCFGDTTGSAVVSVAGGTTNYSYSWSTSPVQTTDNATGLAAGSYSATVTDANGCIQTASVTITEPSVITASVSTQTNLNCFGDSTGDATVSVSGGTSGYTYNWSTAIAQNSATATGLSAGTYTVTVTDANSCTQTASATITEPAALSVTVAGTEPGCAGATTGSALATVTGGTVPYSYSWTGGQTTNPATGLGAGSYTVVVSDSNSCTISASVVITEPGAITAIATAGNDVSCFGGNNGSASVSVSGGTSPYTYDWGGGNIDSTASQLTAGSYIVTVTDANSCSTSDSISISQPTSALTATLTSTTDMDSTGTGTATVSPSGGTSPYTYSWSTTPVQTSQTITGLFANKYIVTVTDNNLCTFIDTVTVDVEVSVENLNNIKFTLSAYPNPNNGEFYLEVISQVNETVEINIVDVIGQSVYRENVNLSAGKNNRHITLETGSNGLFIIQISSINGITYLPVTLMK